MSAPLPDAQALARLGSLLEELVKSIEEHEHFSPTSPNGTLYFVWDFVKRTEYMLSELGNIKSGRSLKHPDQFRPAPGTGQAAAQRVFADVCSRNALAGMIITDTTGKAAMMTGGGPPVDFGSVCKEKAQAVTNWRT